MSLERPRLQEDEDNVKALIKSTIGFREVDRRIEQFMLNWVGNVVQEHLGGCMCVWFSAKWRWLEAVWYGPCNPFHDRGKLSDAP